MSSAFFKISCQLDRLKVSAIHDPRLGLNVARTDRHDQVKVHSRIVHGVYNPYRLFAILRSLKSSDTSEIWGAIAPAESPTQSIKEINEDFTDASTITLPNDGRKWVNTQTPF